MVPEPSLFGYLSYRDAQAGIGWLEALGFGTVVRQDDGDLVVHAELRLGEVVVVASDDAGYERPALKGQSTGRGLYLRTDEVDDLFERAVGAGGTNVIPPEATPWGSRRARVLDVEGNEWTFGSYRPGLGWT
ncbi:VOC family protein [Streptomyces aureus]